MYSSAKQTLPLSHWQRLRKRCLHKDIHSDGRELCTTGKQVHPRTCLRRPTVTWFECYPPSGTCLAWTPRQQVCAPLSLGQEQQPRQVATSQSRVGRLCRSANSSSTSNGGDASRSGIMLMTTSPVIDLVRRASASAVRVTSAPIEVTTTT